MLPTVQRATISAYSQRIDPSTGRERDDYLYSARVSRERFAAFNFDNLAAVDPVAAFDQFDELRSAVTKTGLIKPIEPFPIPTL